MDNIEKYIRNYTNDDADIQFDWNGKYSSKFEDKNQELRRIVIERVLQQPHIAPLSLLRDLFRAETQWSRATWCINRCTSTLASIMLTRGKSEVISDFIDGCYQSFDAYCECGNVNISPILAEEIGAEISKLLAAETDGTQRERLQQNVELFAWLTQKSEV